MLFVGAAEWTRDPDEQEEDASLYVEVSVDGSKEVHRTMPTQIARWDQNLQITGCHSSIVSIEIKSSAHHSSESFTVARAETSFGNLLETCVDDDLAALELTITPLVSGLMDQVTVTDGRKGSEHSTPGTIGFITVKLFAVQHDARDCLQSPDTRADPIQQVDRLERRITDGVEAQGWIDDDIELLAAIISTRAMNCYRCFKQLGNLADLEDVIAKCRDVIALTPEGNPNKLRRLYNLGVIYCMRFGRLGDRADLENAIAKYQEGLALTPDDHPDKADCLFNLNACLKERFELLGHLADLHSAIASLEGAVAISPNNDLLSNLGQCYLVRFERLGDLTDLENSITTYQEAVTLTPSGDKDKPTYLSTLGNCYEARFKRLSGLVDLEKAIASWKEAVVLTPDGHPEKASRLSDIGIGYHTRFERLGDLSDLEYAISSKQEAVTLATDASHPEEKATYLSNLGNSYHRRFERLGGLVDLENAMASYEEALTLNPGGHPGILTNLGAGYHMRFERLGDLGDLEKSISSNEEAVACTLKGHSDMPDYLVNLGCGYQTPFGRLGDLGDLEIAIARWQEAAALIPDGHLSKPIINSNLGIGYHKRFERLGDLADLGKAITSLQEAVTLSPGGDVKKSSYLLNLGGGYHARFERLGDLADLENVIASWQEAFVLTPEGHAETGDLLLNIGTAYLTRFERLGDLADLENSISSYKEAVALTPDSHSKKPGMLSNIGAGYHARFKRLGDLADLENAIASKQKAVTLTPEDHPDKAAHFINLGNSHHRGYEHYHKESHLFSALSSMKWAAQSPGATPRLVLHASRWWAYLSLLSFDVPSALQAFRAAIETLPQVAWLGLDIASRQDWLTKEEPEELGCMAATCAIALGRFEEAVELLDMARSVFWQQASSVRSDLQDLKAEHAVLAEELETASKGLDASSFSGLSAAALDTQLYDRRLAEHRGLVLKWESLITKIRSLSGFEFFLKPKPFNLLREAAPTGRVVIINISKIGADALVFDRNNQIRHVSLSTVDVTNSFKYADDIRLKKARADSDIEDWQRSLTLLEVRDTTDVDILNPSFRSPHWMSGKTTNLSMGGIVQREARADVTEERERSLTLPRLWEHILKPIFAEVGIPLQPSQDQVPTSRILWYLTGPLTFTPIHTAGPVNELVASSYVTTLSSLAEAQMRQRQPLSGPTRLLVITQPDTPELAPIPYSTDEVDTVIKTVFAKGWPEGHIQRFDSACATVDKISNALDTCSWVHFACHAMQHPSDGMESAIALYDGRLKLSRIAAKRLATARFAFLSTCQSASGLQGSPGEAMHLSAGMQFAGFSSVIATMWSIWDEDAPVIAEHTYTYLLRNGLDKIDLTETAAALHYAVSRLQEDPKVTVERWAPFVYYGV